MKKTIMFVLILTITTAVCFAQTDPVEGFWLSIDENTNEVTAGWQIFQQNGRLYGRIVSIANEYRGLIADQVRPNYRDFPIQNVALNTLEVAGPPWIFGLTRRGVGDWRGGNIIDPGDGRMWNCRITFRPAGSSVGRRTFQTDTLEMRGEIGLGIGRSQFWQRSDEQTASNLWLD
ncbi:MAG: DUF2147 domain-containing protein [Treponema sp.]|nr:DUF2147 domain-containing protein [Treponema sp.]